MTGEKKPVYQIGEILKVLPHRFPFLLVDRVDELVVPSKTTKVGSKARAIKNVTFNEPFFPGHFPHRPVMPGVLQIEAMAQVAAIACIEIDGPPMDVVIAGVDKARFRRAVVPGDTLEMTAEVLKERSQMIIVRCEARVRGEVVCEAEMIAKMSPIQDMH